VFAKTSVGFNSSGSKTLTNDREETTVIITPERMTPRTVRKHIVEGVQIILLARQYRFTHK